jgi:hypothetical protein
LKIGRRPAIWCSIFDHDEHAEMWVEGRGKNGVPGTIRQLLDDAEAIDKMLQDLAAALAETEGTE